MSNRRVYRDSKVLWLPVLGAILTYLMASEPPTMWSYHDWIKALAAGVAAVSTKYMNSSLPRDPNGSKS